MKIVIVHGQDHEGSTCMTARKLANAVTAKAGKGASLEEFFLPRDFSEPCRGCYGCFNRDLTVCPHFKKLQPLSDALMKADLIILASPVYVYHAACPMMSFLDHFGTWWVVHRPRTEMTCKQAVAVSTAAGGGMRSTCKDMRDSLEMWGINRVYSLGIGVQATKPEGIPERILKAIDKKTDALADRIVRHGGSRGMNRRAKKWFALMRFAHKHFAPSEPDFGYWERKGWHGSKRPWKD